MGGEDEAEDVAGGLYAGCAEETAGGLSVVRDVGEGEKKRRSCLDRGEDVKIYPTIRDGRFTPRTRKPNECHTEVLHFFLPS